MRQVELVVQVATDEEADEIFADLSDMADQFQRDRAETGEFALLDLFVADDLGTVSRP